MTVHSGTLKREIELDFVRGVAILMVVDFHSPFGLMTRPLEAIGLPHFGWIGVNVFFVLSGFLVGGLLMKEWKVRRGIDSGRFLVRRGFKIWPQYYVYLACAVGFGRHTLRETWGNFLNIQNYTNGIAHTWSLAIEEHAYLLLVLCLGIAARQKARVRSLFVFLAGVCVFICALRYALSSRQILVFLPTHTRVDSILMGVLLAMLYHFAPARFAWLQQKMWLWWLGLGLALLPLWLVAWTGKDPWFMVPLRLDAANLLGLSVFFLAYRKVGSAHSWPYRVIAWVGVYSYGIYLWHVSLMQPVITFAGKHPRMPYFADGLLVLLSGVTIGVVTTKLIEFPALRLRDRLYPRRVDSAAGIPAVVEVETGVQSA